MAFRIPHLLDAAMPGRALATLAERTGETEQAGDEGFTLIELMVVLLIMAILLAIAIPTFLGVKGGAQDRAAQSNLSNALISAKSIFATTGTYPSNITATLATQEPELSFLASAGTAAKGTNQISLGVSPSGNTLIVVNQSASGTCWALADNNGDGALSAVNGNAANGTSYAAWKDSNACTASGLMLNTATGAWSNSYPTTPATSGY
jgi:type IV pilus assembly protein PilA